MKEKAEQAVPSDKRKGLYDMTPTDCVLLSIIEDKVKADTIKLRDILDARDLASPAVRWVFVRMIEDMKRLFNGEANNA